MHWLDPDFLPQTTGTLDRFVLNPHGDIDGLLLSGDIEIHTPPHLSAQLLAALQPGDHVTVRGVKTRRGGVIVAVAVEPEKGARIDDAGKEKKKHPKPPHPHKADNKAADHQGVVERLLHGPKGDAHGALMEDGTIVRFPPHSADTFVDVLRVGAPLSVRGMPVATPIGNVINANALGKRPSSLVDIPEDHKPGPKKPPKGHGPKKHPHHA